MISARPASPNPGFTLIELMVVTAVLAVFLMMTSIVTRNAVDLHGATRTRLATERNAAAFMRQFEADLAQRVTRRESSVRYGKLAGNDNLTLVTQRRGYALHDTTPDRQASLVSYHIRQNMLWRAAGGYGFGKPSDRPAEETGTLALAEIPAIGPAEPADKAFQVIAPGIIRLEFSFLVRDADTGKHLVRATPPDHQDLIDVVVATIVTLDPDRTGMLDAAKLEKIAAAFPDAGDNELPLAKWSAIAARLPRDLPQLPATALQQVRVHQGIFTLPNSPPQP